ncbi:MAG: hypothetical protein V4584_08860 [Verrucomicrobiota bacterium]
MSNKPAISKNRREAPWVAGLHAARANVVPGLIVQGLMLSILLAYYFYPPMRNWLNSLAEIKARWSYGYSAINAIIAGALIPELLRIGVFQKGGIRRSNFANLLFSVPFWCVMGVVVDFFYRCQAAWFGAEPTFAVVLKKVLVDQFLYNPFYAAPVTAWLYDWKNRGYPRHGLGGFFTVEYYRDVVLPTLFATWGVWIPVVAILYSLPSLLQIPLFGLALSLWVILYTWMSEQRAGQ